MVHYRAPGVEESEDSPSDWSNNNKSLTLNYNIRQYTTGSIIWHRRRPYSWMLFQLWGWTSIGSVNLQQNDSLKHCTVEGSTFYSTFNFSLDLFGLLLIIYCFSKCWGVFFSCFLKCGCEIIYCLDMNILAKVSKKMNDVFFWFCHQAFCPHLQI